MTVAAIAAAGAALSGCTSSGHPAAARGSGSATTVAGQESTSTTLTPAEIAGSRLRGLLIKPEVGYQEDATVGATGSITPAAFTSLGGGGTAAQAGFVAGYRDNYVNNSTNEALTITIMQFKSGAGASSYLARTAGETLTGSAPIRRPFAPIPGATEITATKAYSGEWAYGVVMAHGVYYASVVYVNLQQMTSLPIQFDQWATVQYVNLR